MYEVIERRQRQNTKQPEEQKLTGMKCPQCNNFIPITLYLILSSTSIQCPACGLVLNIDRTKSQKAIEALKKIEETQKEAESKE